ncbi:MAG TPA: LysR substrate-binding domain-containing protein [Burkholderiales bacterium]|nr:LysR substrate-binding domain-containing protein [Burkholderiales bacterium]
MNLQQLRSVCAIADQGLRISRAARVLHRSQPSITRQVKELEEDVGFSVFNRRQNRVLSITPEGAHLIAAARRMLREADNIRLLGREMAHVAHGELTIATTHTHARHTLPAAIERFMAAYPGVKMRLRQGTPVECAELVATGNADIAISSRVAEPPRGVTYIPCYRLSRSVIARVGHPVLRRRKLTLEILAQYPLIAFDEAYCGQNLVYDTFTRAGLAPNIVLSAVDAEVSKAYVAKGLGIAVLASVAFDAAQDVNLRMIPAATLFDPVTLHIVAPRYGYMRQYLYEFIQMFAPHLRRPLVQEITASAGASAVPSAESIPVL